jgi:hypothetical protein
MLTRTHITLLLVLAVVTWAIALWVLGLPFTWEYSKPFAITVSILSGACFAFDKWLWKWPIFNSWLVSQPNLHGTWKVLLKSDWINPETKQQVAPIECIMTIRQTLSLPKSQIRAYRWCSPPRIGWATMSPNRSIARVQGASFPSDM